MVGGAGEADLAGGRIRRRTGPGARAAIASRGRLSRDPQCPRRRADATLHPVARIRGGKEKFPAIVRRNQAASRTVQGPQHQPENGSPP